MTAEPIPTAHDPTYEPPRRIQVEEYLRLSTTLPGCYEYWDGFRSLVYGALRGSTHPHARTSPTWHAHEGDFLRVLYWVGRLL